MLFEEYKEQKEYDDGFPESDHQLAVAQKFPHVVFWFLILLWRLDLDKSYLI